MASFNVTSSLPGEFVTTNATDSDPVCVSRQKPAFLVFCLLPSVAILINVVVLVAVLRKTRKLVRQSHVYAHVSSTLIANVLLSVLGLVELLSLYFHFGGVPDAVDPGKRGLVQEGASHIWAYRKSFLCAIFVIMCGNIGLLIDAIRHSTCSTLRTAAGCRSHPSDHNGRWKKKLLTRRQRSFLLIALLWVVPIFYVIIPMAVGWSCRGLCLCLSQCFPSNHVHVYSDQRCSRSIPPMSNSWLVGVVASWACCLAATIFFLHRSLQQVTKMWFQGYTGTSVKGRESRSASKSAHSSLRMSIAANMEDEPSKDEVFLSENSDKTDKSADSSLEKSICADSSCCLKPLGDEGVAGDEKTSEFGSRRNYFSVSRHSRPSETSFSSLAKLKASAPRRMMEHFRSTRSSTFTLRYVIWLTVSFGVLTAPTMAIITIDMLYPDLVLNMVALNICLLCPFTYCYICPFVLVKCLPGVKTSLSALILSVYSTTD